MVAVTRWSGAETATSPFFPCFLLQRFASEKEGDREVQRTMLELLNQLDGFSSNNDIKARVLLTHIRAENNYLVMLGHMSKQTHLWSDAQIIWSDVIFNNLLMVTIFTPY